MTFPALVEPAAELTVDEVRRYKYRGSSGKVNLALEVLRRRPDGYHEVDTVMTAVSASPRMSAVSISAPDL